MTGTRMVGWVLRQNERIETTMKKTLTIDVTCKIHVITSPFFISFDSYKNSLFCDDYYTVSSPEKRARFNLL